MTRRRLTLVLISFLLAAWLLYLFLPRNAGMYRAVPAASALVLDLDGALRAKVRLEKNKDANWQKAFQSELFKQCFTDVEAAAELFKNEPALLRALAGAHALAAFSLHPADSLHALFVVEVAEDFSLQTALTRNPLTQKFFPHRFHGVNIFNVHLSRNERMELAQKGRLLLFSRKAILVEDAIAQLDQLRNWWADRPYMAELPDAPLKCYLRPATLAAQWQSFMLPERRAFPDLVARNVEWAGMTYGAVADAFLIETKGFCAEISHWAKKSRSSTLYEILPDNTAFVARAALKDIPDFYKRMGEGSATDFDQYVLPWAGDEAALVITEPLSPAMEQDRLLCIAVRDSARAVQKLAAWAKNRGVSPEESGAYQMFDITGFQDGGLLKPLLGADEAFRTPACTILKGYAVFAPDRPSLEVFLDKYVLGQSLPPMPRPAAPLEFFLNTTFIQGICEGLFNQKQPHTDAASYLRAGHFQLQFEPGFGRKAVVKSVFQAVENPPAQTDLRWKTGLQAPMIGQAGIIPQSEGKVMVLVQDNKFQLYCLDAANGSIQWRKQLSEPVLGDFHAIDFYSNGIHCILFNTPSQLMALDENGRDIEGFPFKLPAPATNGLLAADFERNNRVNYFVACRDERMYGFAHNRRTLDGWNSIPTQGRISAPFVHLQHKGKDYIATLTQSGLLSVYGRDGALRFEPLQLEGRFDAGLCVDTQALNPQFYAANRSGTVFACNLQGVCKALQVAEAGSSITFAQLSGDERYEWAALEGRQLRVGDWSGKVLFSRRFTETPQQVFNVQGTQLGLSDTRNHRVMLIDQQKPVLSLGGNTAFDICRVHQLPLLITGNGKSVWAYRINKP